MRYLVLIGVLVAGAGAYSAYWFQVAGAIEPGIAAWADERRAEGFEVAYGGVSVSGFPFRLVVTVHQPSIGRPHPTRAWRWRAPALAAVAQPWNFRHLILSLDGRHRLAYLSQGVWRELSARAEVPMVSVVLGRDGQLERFAIDLQGLEASASGWSERLEAKRIQLHGRPIADGDWIGAGEAVATKVALALMAREEAEGKVARVPVTAQQGRLYLGPLPLLRLAPILPAPLKKSP